MTTGHMVTLTCSSCGRISRGYIASGVTIDVRAEHEPDCEYQLAVERGMRDGLAWVRANGDPIKTETRPVEGDA